MSKETSILENMAQSDEEQSEALRDLRASKGWRPWSGGCGYITHARGAIRLALLETSYWKQHSDE